jgi:alpha-glucosidase
MADKQFKYENNILCATISGNYQDGLPLANVTFAGLPSCPSSIWASCDGKNLDTSGVQIDCQNSTVRVTSLEGATSGGAWTGSELKIGLNY